MTMRKPNERMRKFALAYARLGNATKAAIEAGYSEKAASSQGYQLSRNPQVLTLIESARIKRDVHADQTYQQLIAIANASMKLANDALNDPACDRKEKVGCLEGARRAVETVARVEGLMIELPPRRDEGALTLQILAQKIRTGIDALKKPELPAPAPEPIIIVTPAAVEAREVDVDQAPVVENNGHAA